MTIRVASAADEDRLINLWKDAGLIHGDLVDHYLGDLRSKRAFQPELLFVAEADGDVVGSVMAGYDGRRGWINCLAVAPTHQKLGLGSQLVAYAEQHLDRLGCRKINLQVRSSNAGVIEFYDKLGYSQDDVISLGKRIRD